MRGDGDKKGQPNGSLLDGHYRFSVVLGAEFKGH